MWQIDWWRGRGRESDHPTAPYCAHHFSVPLSVFFHRAKTHCLGHVQRAAAAATVVLLQVCDHFQCQPAFTPVQQWRHSRQCWMFHSAHSVAIQHILRRPLLLYFVSESLAMFHLHVNHHVHRQGNWANHRRIIASSSEWWKVAAAVPAVPSASVTSGQVCLGCDRRCRLLTVVFKPNHWNMPSLSVPLSPDSSVNQVSCQCCCQSHSGVWLHSKSHDRTDLWHLTSGLKRATAPEAKVNSFYSQTP